MPAPSIAVLLNYEGNIEDAIVAHIAALYPNYQVLTARTAAADEGKLQTPRVEVELVTAGSGSARNDRLVDGREYESHRLGSLTIRVVARRDAAGQDLGAMRGQMRYVMLPATMALTDVTLPYYEIADISEGSSTPGIFLGNDEIMSDLEWAIQWFIKPDAWPAS